MIIKYDSPKHHVWFIFCGITEFLYYERERNDHKTKNDLEQNIVHTIV